MRDHSQHIELSREDAVASMLDAWRFERRVEDVPLSGSFGRVLAEDVVAQVTLPNCLTSRMDSVAVRWSDFEQGIPDTSGWTRGIEWEFANTGVGMPVGFDTAVVIEHAEVSDDNQYVTFKAAPSAQFAGTSEPGSRMHAGDVLLEAGTVITPLLAAHMASGNNQTVTVVAKPRVAFIPTGDELVKVGSDIPRGGNIDSNTILLKGKIEQMGAEPILFDIVRDNQEDIERALRRAAEQADIVVINAGSSKGSDDWTLELLEQIGTIICHQTNHGPGHHSSYSFLEGTPIVGISGPPGGAAFTTDFYLEPLVKTYLGLNPNPTHISVKLAQPFKEGHFDAMINAQNPKPLAGEERPPEDGIGGVFYSIRQLKVSVDESGCLQAIPTKNFKPGPVEAEGANAYYALQSGKHEQRPQVGDVFHVELRSQGKIKQGEAL